MATPSDAQGPYSLLCALEWLLTVPGGPYAAPKVKPRLDSKQVPSTHPAALARVRRFELTCAVYFL